MDEKEAKIWDPKEKLKNLTSYGSSIEVDYNVPAEKYFRSGVEMTRMANVYHKEGNLEHAFLLYIKFMTLFVEKIRKHPGYKTVPQNLKEKTMENLKNVMPIAEELKKLLLEQYTAEHKMYLEEIKAQNIIRAKQQDIQPSIDNLGIANKNSKPETPKVNVATPLKIDKIIYPELDDNKKPDTTPISQGCSKPSINRSTKPTIEDNIYSHYKLLRLVIVPSKLVTEFLRIANKNTLINKETCGILAGIPKNNQFQITHLIIPKQKGTSDTCSTINEEELSEYINDNNLFSLGWIHTHPTQTAFLSAVDLHTQYSYQRLFDESIAIVCAPRYGENEIYTLTQDYGLPLIGKCRETGFHTHPTEKPIYKRAEHIQLNDVLPIRVIDLQLL